MIYFQVSIEDIFLLTNLSGFLCFFNGFIVHRHQVNFKVKLNLLSTDFLLELVPFSTGLKVVENHLMPVLHFDHVL